MATATKKADAKALPRLKAEYRKEIAPALQKEFWQRREIQKGDLKLFEKIIFIFLPMVLTIWQN